MYCHNAFVYMETLAILVMEKVYNMLMCGQTWNFLISHRKQFATR